MHVFTQCKYVTENFAIIHLEVMATFEANFNLVLLASIFSYFIMICLIIENEFDCIKEKKKFYFGQTRIWRQYLYRFPYSGTQQVSAANDGKGRNRIILPEVEHMK